MKINKRIAISFITIAGVLTAVVGITLAQFGDTATLTGNTLSTATPNLEIDNDACTSFSSSAQGVVSPKLAPGETASRNFCLKNASTGGASFDVTAAVAVTSGGLDQNLVTLTINCGLPGPVSGTLNSFPSDKVVTITAGSIANCTITEMLSGSATGGASNKSVTYTVTFTGDLVPPPGP